ncbi:hypothetical protein DFH08DRAFT_754190 [Mycena albidolilacea]|uniref:Uncharacterized protein n=1 Tax=Mycena albidolilacea TaxID=1033008 RepID=A0AAD6ZF09_9AGAR|nr:hypothetical protein DFH08DRAFT_754190 [Mycena albidolilacea]
MPSLLLLSLLHLIALNCSVSGHPPLSREQPIYSDPDINSRTLFNIVSGCLATVFACTWVTVHPNVPGPNQGKLALAWRRLGLMLVGIIAPELIAGFAARQFLDARWFSNEYGVSITHGFFFAMGGFVSADGHHPVATEEQLRLRPDYLAAIRSIREGDIEDRSKGDLLSKGVILLQGLWFTIQCLARVHQHLPLTELEVATLAFQFVNIFIWLLWLHKPLDVQQPILLGPANEFVPLAKLPESRPLLHRIGAVPAALLGGYYSDLNFSAFTSVPSFWSTHKFGVGVPGSVGFTSKFIFIQFLVGTVFGLIHCTAWNVHFPSTAELLIWRSCSLVIAATPFTLTLVYILAALYSKLPLHWRRKRLTEKLLSLSCDIVVYAPSAAYIAARLILIVLSFVTLRALPPGAFVDVNWSTYIPHL